MPISISIWRGSLLIGLTVGSLVAFSACHGNDHRETLIISTKDHDRVEIRLGQSAAGVAHKLGGTRIGRLHECQDLALAIMTDQTGQVIAVLAGSVMNAEHAKRFTGETGRGIKIGATVNDILAAYGTPDGGYIRAPEFDESVVKKYYGDRGDDSIGTPVLRDDPNIEILSYKAIGLTFTIMDGTLAHIALRTREFSDRRPY